VCLIDSVVVQHVPGGCLCDGRCRSLRRPASGLNQLSVCVPDVASGRSWRRRGARRPNTWLWSFAGGGGRHAHSAFVPEQPPPRRDSKLRGVPTYTRGPSYQYFFNWFNSLRPPFSGVRVRQAMWHALDLEGMVGDRYGDSASIARAPIIQDVFGAADLAPYAYDPAPWTCATTPRTCPDGGRDRRQGFGRPIARAHSLVRVAIEASSSRS
jgi:hypothetical protein